MIGINNRFPTNLKFLRQHFGFSREELGDILNKDYTTIGKWENGTRSPTMQDTLDICNYFKVDLNDIILNDLKLEAAKGMVIGEKIKRKRYVSYLPNNIYYLRKNNNITQQQLADKFGYSDCTITNWESDKRTPNIFDLLELSAIFSVSIDDLVKVDLEKESLGIKKYTKKEVKEKVTNIVTNSELEDNKKQMIISVVDVSCEEKEV